jgi:SNF2 family DNA or RNA helicase
MAVSDQSVCPLVMVYHVILRSLRHIHDGQLRTALYHGSSRHLVVDDLHEQDVVLTTYETLRNDFEAKGPLYKRQWHRIVLDEGTWFRSYRIGRCADFQTAHHIRNRKSQIFAAVCSVQSTFRWCLTGTPVHNSLDDYGALLSFLRVPSFTSKAMFDHWITKPIQQKKQEGFSRLQILVRTTCLRRTKDSIGDALDLPQRREEVEFVPLQPQDQELYNFFKSKAAELASGATTLNPATATRKLSQDGSVLSLLNFLRLTCNHGQQILPKSALQLWSARDRTLANHDKDEMMVNGDDGSAPVFSAKVLALLKNLILTHTPSFDSNGRLVVKRYDHTISLIRLKY